MLSKLDWRRQEGLTREVVLRRLAEMPEPQRLGVTELNLRDNQLQAVPDELPSLLPDLGLFEASYRASSLPHTMLYFLSPPQAIPRRKPAADPPRNIRQFHPAASVRSLLLLLLLPLSHPPPQPQPAQQPAAEPPRDARQPHPADKVRSLMLRLPLSHPPPQTRPELQRAADPPLDTRQPHRAGIVRSLLLPCLYLTLLHSLDLTGNQLQSLPETLGSLTQLKV